MALGIQSLSHGSSRRSRCRAAGWRLSLPFSPGGTTVTSTVVLRDHCLRGSTGPFIGESIRTFRGFFNTPPHEEGAASFENLWANFNCNWGLLETHQTASEFTQLPEPTKQRRAPWSGWERSWQPRSHAPGEAAWVSPSPPATSVSQAPATMQRSEAAWPWGRNTNTAVQERRAQLLCDHCGPTLWQARGSNGPREL